MFGWEKKPQRFVMKENHTVGVYGLSVICDMVTGVNYLAAGGDGLSLSCITPLLDENGNVVIDRNMPEQ